jgi:hypothetical protein
MYLRGMKLLHLLRVPVLSEFAFSSCILAEMHHRRKEHGYAPEDSAACQKIRKNGHGGSCVRSYTTCESMSLRVAFIQS